jgi:hypothetical protein
MTVLNGTSSMPDQLRRIFQIGIAVSAFTLLFLLAFGLPGRALDANGTMPVTEITTQVIGRKLIWRSLDGSLGVHGEILFTADGKVAMTTNIPGLETDQGNWWFDEDQLCTRWSSARDGEAKCYRLIDQGAGRYMTTGGNLFEKGGDPLV